MNVASGTTYTVQVELMITDLSSSQEYATITVGTTELGTCDGGNTCDGCCTWYTCQGLTSNQITSTSTNINLVLQYSSEVSSTHAACTDSVSGSTGGGVARITLTPASKM